MRTFSSSPQAGQDLSLPKQAALSALPQPRRSQTYAGREEQDGQSWAAVKLGASAAGVDVEAAGSCSLMAAMMTLRYAYYVPLS
jgi:hypothetical protein